ncbi:MAG TPA: OpgC domain-containing protein [Hyphomicrobiaceae bacterium]|nr:OpgC domain-containing protein [Hyphomicrobiaceae bacterium]
MERGVKNPEGGPEGACAASTTRSGGRDARLDFVRGLALIFIFIDHAPSNALAKFTLGAFGMCDAAEVFVIVAGLTAALVYAATFQEGFRGGLQRTLQRVGKIYRAQMFTSLLCIGVLLSAALWTQDARYWAHPTLKFLPDTAVEAIAGALSLYVQPGYLNILPLYIALMLWLPAALWLARHHVLLPLVPSLAIWALANFGLNLPTYGRPGGWFFNPFAWQLLFTIGIVIGLIRRQGLTIPRSTPVLIAAVAYLVFAFGVAAPWTVVPALSSWRFVDPTWMAEASKQNLSILRLVNVLALAYVAVVLFKRDLFRLNAGVLGMVTTMGRNSLLVFCLATVLDECLLVVRLGGFRGFWYQAGINAGGLLLLWGAAMLSERWFRSRSARTRGSRVPISLGGAAAGGVR